MNVELCPETGICSIIANDGRKVDLMPDEVARIREGADKDAARRTIGEVDAGFAESLAAEDVERIAKALKGK